MTSLLNPNDIEIKNKLINNINKCIDNVGEIYSFSKKNILSIVNNYSNNHLKLNIDKDKLLEYIILLIQKKVFDFLITKYYNQVNLVNIESINTFNSYILTITNNNYENNEPLLNLIQNTYNKWGFNIQDIDLIYYNIYNLKKNNDEYLNLINISIDELDKTYNFIKEMKENNEIQMNDIKELTENNEIQMNDIKELKETIKYHENIIIIFLLFKIIMIIYYYGVNIK